MITLHCRVIETVNPQVDNPYEPQREDDVDVQLWRYPPDIRKTHLAAFLLAGFGTPIGAMLCSVGLIPYTRFSLWFPFFLMISYGAISGEIATNFDVTEVTCTAMLVIGIVIVSLAAATSFFMQRLSVKDGSK